MEKVRKLFKGWIGEKITEQKLSLSLDSGVYNIYHDIIIPSRNGTTQIDHVIISPYGLFVIETKNLKGWIYGTVAQSKCNSVNWLKRNNEKLVFSICLSLSKGLL